MDQTQSTVAGVADELRESFGDEVTVAVHDDATEMTPMLSVQVESARTRADLLRTLYAHEDGALTVEAVHSHQIIVRGEQN